MTTYRTLYKSDNPILDWYSQDEQVKSVIDGLSVSGKTIEEQAAAAFEELSEAFDLPKYPHSFTEEHYDRFSGMGIDEPRSVSEEAAVIRYLDPEEDPRGIVMLALFHVLNGIQVPIQECAIKHFGGKRKIPKEYMVCFPGEGIQGKLHFLKEGESWFELGASSAIKITK